MKTTSPIPRVVALVTLIALAPFQLAAREGEGWPTATDADLLHALGSIGAKLDLLQIELEKGTPSQVLVEVRNVQPRHLLHQARTLHQWCAKLNAVYSFQKPPPVEPQRNVETTPGDIMAVLDASQGLLGKTHRILGLQENPTAGKTSREEALTPEHLFQEILTLNLKARGLLEGNLVPMDTYQALTRCIIYTSHLSSRHRGFRRVPRIQQPVDGQTVMDVASQLLDCHGLVKQLAGIYGAKPMDWSFTRGAKDRQPGTGEIHDLAVILESDLAYLCLHMGLGTPRREALLSGPKDLAQISQRTRYLGQQLANLLDAEGTNPGTGE